MNDIHVEYRAQVRNWLKSAFYAVGKVLDPDWNYMTSLDYDFFGSGSSVSTTIKSQRA